MAKSEVFVQFKLPEPLPLGYPFRVFAEHVIDRVPEFQNVSGARKGAILLDAVEKAEKDEAPNLVVWPEALWKIVCKTLNSETFQLPRLAITAGSLVTDQIVNLRRFLPFADAILEASVVPEGKPDAAPVE